MSVTEELLGDDLASTRGDRRALLSASATICVLVAAGAAFQAVWVYGAVLPGGGAVPFEARLLANLVALATNLGVLVLLRTSARRGAWPRAGAAVGAAVIAAGVRVVAQQLVELYPVPTASVRLTEFASGFGVALAANLLGLGFLTARQRIRHEALVAATGKLHYRWALQALQREEIRVRRDVAEGLHGSLQQHLVLLTARIDSLADRLSVAPVTPAELAELREISSTLNTVRESDVREISRMIYPDGIEVGMVAAVRSMLVRLPPTIATHLEVSDAVRRLDDPALPQLSQVERLLAVRIVEEGITNALRHGGATSVDVRLSATGQTLQIAVSDDGRGFAGPIVQSGTARLAERLALVDGELELTSPAGQGARLTASFAVTAPVTG